MSFPDGHIQAADAADEHFVFPALHFHSRGPAVAERENKTATEVTSDDRVETLTVINNLQTPP